MDGDVASDEYPEENSEDADESNLSVFILLSSHPYQMPLYRYIFEAIKSQWTDTETLSK